jgi:hypothetical protein
MEKEGYRNYQAHLVVGKSKKTEKRWMLIRNLLLKTIDNYIKTVTRAN